MTANAVHAARTKIEGLLNDNPILNSVHRGQIDDFLKQETNFYPAARVDVGNATVTNEVIKTDIYLTIVDMVDEDFENEDFALNNALTIGSRIIAQLQEAVHDANFELIADPSFDRLVEYGDANLAGYGVTIELIQANKSHAN